MYTVCVEDAYAALLARYVAEGQGVAPGAKLLDIMTPDGMVHTIRSEGWGIVAHIEGGRVFDNDNEALEEEDNEDNSIDGESGVMRSTSGGSEAVFSKGDIICHIVGRDVGGGSVRDGRLHPRNQPSARYRRLMGLSRG